MRYSNIEVEIMAVVPVEKRLGESRQEFLARLMRIVCGQPGFSDDQWESLSSNTRKWLNDNVCNMDRRIEINDPLGSYAVELEELKPEGKKSAGLRAKEIMLDHNFDIKPKEILAQLKEEGYKYSLSTLRVVVAEARQMWKLLNKRGMINDDY